jgi:hypothetical protein
VRVIHLPDGVQPDQLPAKAALEILKALENPAVSANREWCAMRPAAQVTEREDTERRILPSFVRYGVPTQPASSVRGSSRRIMTMRFPSADIRVINRRKLPLVSCPARRLQKSRRYSRGGAGNS